jgi:hypothetical protein
MLTNTGLPPSDPRIEMAGFASLGTLAEVKPTTYNGK